MSEKFNNNGYGEDSIDELKNEETVRKRPSVMLGTDDERGAFHAFGELVANVVDEKKAGFGDKVFVHVDEEGYITIRDEGRGVPMGYNKRLSKFNWHLVYNQLYAGGKYGSEENKTKKQDKDKVVFTIGLNGLGASSCQFTSESFEVVSKRQEGTYRKAFYKGKPVPVEEEKLAVAKEFYKKEIQELEELIEVTEDIVEKSQYIQKLDYILTQAPEITLGQNEVTGTTVRFKPDIEVFTSIDFTPKMFETYLESQAYISGLSVDYKNEKHGVSKVYEGEGLEGLLNIKLVSEPTTVMKRETSVTESYDSKQSIYFYEKAEIIIALTEDIDVGVDLHFHNTGKMQNTYNSVHHNASRNAISDFFKAIGKEHGVSIKESDFSRFITVATSTYSTETSFANQTKDAISNHTIYSLIYNNVLDMLEGEYAKNRGELSDFIERVLREAEIRKELKNIENATRDIKVATKPNALGKIQKPEKYWDIKKYGKNAELYLVEGDSAGGSASDARDGLFQAIMAFKGKPVNVLKKNLNEILANKEIRDLITIMGAGIDINGADIGKKAFDINKLRFGKFIILTDADEDGNQIRVLIFLIFFYFFPEIIRRGMLYIGESPILTNEMADGTYTYAYTPDEQIKLLEQFKKEGRRVVSVKRSKGLGSNNKEQMAESTMNVETRRLTQIKFDVNDIAVYSVVTQIFGDANTDTRKEFVRRLVKKHIEENRKYSDIQELAKEVELVTNDKEVVKDILEMV